MDKCNEELMTKTENVNVLASGINLLLKKLFKLFDPFKIYIWPKPVDRIYQHPDIYIFWQKMYYFNFQGPLLIFFLVPLITQSDVTIFCHFK